MLLQKEPEIILNICNDGRDHDDCTNDDDVHENDCGGCMSKWNDSTCWNNIYTDLIYVYLYHEGEKQQLESFDSDKWTFTCTRLCSLKFPKSVYYNIF